MQSNNSANRLYNFITYCEKRNHLDIKLANTLCSYYGTNHGNNHELFSTVKLYTDLTTEVEKKLLQHEELGDEYRKILAPILNGCTPTTLMHSTRDFLSKINGQPKTALHACTAFFGQLENETKISQEVLNGLEKQISELENEIITSVEDKELREVLSQLIFTAKQGLADYKLMGVTSFKRTFETLLGKLVVEYSRKDDSTASVFNNFGLLLKTLGEISGAANNIHQLATNITPVLKAIGC